jgi:hypothetical protein
MKMNTRMLVLFAALSGLLVAGCSSVNDHSALVVNEAPPPPKVETVGIAPSSNYDWVAGRWAYRDSAWNWVPGSWQPRPRPNAAWIPGHWDQTDHSWTWTPGHWE